MTRHDRPTWLIVLVVAVSAYSVARPATLLGAFREDGLPFLLVAALLIVGAVTTVRERRAARRAAQHAYAARLEEYRRRRSGTLDG